MYDRYTEIEEFDCTCMTGIQRYDRYTEVEGFDCTRLLKCNSRA